MNWRSKKQLVVTRSSAKAEYRAMALGICEPMWIRTPRKELQVDVQEPMRLYCDNRTTLNIVHNSVQHDRTNRIDTSSMKILIMASFVLLLFHLNYS